jgi:hypothetical protein
VTAEIDVLVAAAAGALGGGVVKPLLAPVDALAEHWRDRVRERLAHVAEAAARKSDHDPLLVDERTAFRVFLDAAAVDDQIVLEYLAGVVAGTAEAGDEGLPVLAQINRLSSFQLRLHYVAYRALWTLQSLNLTIFLPGDALAAIFNESFERLVPLLESAGYWLQREGLLPDRPEAYQVVERGETFTISHQPHDRTFAPTGPGVVVAASAYGADFFAWGCGRPRQRGSPFSLDDPVPELDPPIASLPAVDVDELPLRGPSCEKCSGATLWTRSTRNERARIGGRQGWRVKEWRCEVCGHTFFSRARHSDFLTYLSPEGRAFIGDELPWAPTVDQT